MFKIGDCVSYRSEGVCQITDIRLECFNTLNKSEEYYILTPLNDKNSKLYVPTSNELLTSQMKPLLSEKEIKELVAELKGQGVDWITDSRARSTYFKQTSASGERRQLILLFNTLDKRLWQDEGRTCGKKAYTAGDETVYKRVKRILFDEFSKTIELRDEDELVKLLRGE